MNEEDRWNYLITLDEELLVGGVTLSEWCSAIVREADKAFIASAHLGCLLTAVAGIESYLRSEVNPKNRLVDLIDSSGLSIEVRDRLHVLRKYRNSWVHIDDPWNDHEALSSPQEIESQLEDFAAESVRLLREVIYSNPWV